MTQSLQLQVEASTGHRQAPEHAVQGVDAGVCLRAWSCAWAAAVRILRRCVAVPGHLHIVQTSASAEPLLKDCRSTNALSAMIFAASESLQPQDALQ